MNRSLIFSPAAFSFFLAASLRLSLSFFLDSFVALASVATQTNQWDFLLVQIGSWLCFAYSLITFILPLLFSETQNAAPLLLHFVCKAGGLWCGGVWCGGRTFAPVIFLPLILDWFDILQFSEAGTRAGMWLLLLNICYCWLALLLLQGALSVP